MIENYRLGWLGEDYGGLWRIMEDYGGLWGLWRVIEFGDGLS
jgi:hypothetical protein